MCRVRLSSVAILAAAFFAGCSAPVALPQEADGRLISLGAGPGGPDDACFTCHGLRGEGDGRAPRLAGQPVGYLIKQLEDYAGKWRRDPQMVAIAARLRDADRVTVARYYSQLRGQPANTLPEASAATKIFLEGDQSRGIRACAECHAENGGGGLAAPRLAGQPFEYIEAQLEAFRLSKRRNDPQDIMGGIARKLTPHEIRQLARQVEAIR